MKEILLEPDVGKHIFSDYVCEITRDLDHMSNLDSNDKYGYYHYIVADNADIAEHMLAIRVPGGTVGEIGFDDNYIINHIAVDTDYVIKTYFRNVNKHIKRKYIGCKIIIPEIKNEEDK